VDRAALCREHAPTEYEEAMSWALTLAIDGAFYYLATGGEVCAMLAVLNSEPLAPSCGVGCVGCGGMPGFRWNRIG
jgi:hypothetical protein